MVDGDWRSLDTGVIRLWRQHLAVPVAALGVASIAGMAVATAAGTVLVAAIPVAVVLAGAALLLVRYPGFRHRTWSYRLGDEALEVVRGALFRQRSVIPYFRVQNVELSSGPLERRLGLVRLKVRTAAPGSDAEIPGLREPDAVAARARILERAGDTSGV